MSETDPHKAMPDFSVRGQHAVITGGSGGIGGAFARAFVAHGATVTITDLVEPSAPLPAGIAAGFLKTQPALGLAGWLAQRFCSNCRSRASISARGVFCPRKIADSTT